MSVLSSLSTTLLTFAGLVGLGACVANRQWVGKEIVSFLGNLVFKIGMPALIIASLARTDLAILANFNFIGCFVLGTLLTTSIAIFFSRRWFAQGLSGTTLYAMSSAYVNSVNLGFPIAQNLLGTVAPALVIGLVQVLFITPSIITLIEFEKHGKKGVKNFLVGLPKTLLFNPIILACFIGLMLHVIPTTLLSQINLTPLDVIGKIAIPLSLLLLGYDLANAALEGNDDNNHWLQIFLAVFLKLMVQPMLAAILGMTIFNLSPSMLFAVVLIAALPTAQNNYIFAKQYGISVSRAARIVTVSTILFGVTISVIITLFSP